MIRDLVLLTLLLVPAPLTSVRGGHVSEGDERNPAVFPPQRIESWGYAGARACDGSRVREVSTLSGSD